VFPLTIPLLVAGLGFATPSDQAYERAVDLVERLYLYPNTVTPTSMLHSAGLGLSKEVDWLLVSVEGPAVVLRRGDGTLLGSVTANSWDALPGSLRDLERIALAAGRDLGKTDVRLEVLKGMSEALDRHSRVMAGEKLERFDTRLKGTMVGIGLQVTIINDKMQIISLVDGGPAARAGIEVGDLLQRIDGRSTLNLSSREAARLMQGEAESPVLLEISHEGTPRNVVLARQEIVLPNVTHEILAGKVGYVQISHVSQQTVENLQEALRKLKAQGGLDVGLIIDLRENSGGSMKEAARSADEFLTDGMLLRTAGPDGGRVQNLQARMDAENSGHEPTIPIVMLVDERTASGAEIMAGALYELDRAAVIGEKTYGKGTVQKIYSLDEETRFKLTVAQYLLANDRVIADVGLVPDVVIGHIELGSGEVRYRGFDPATAGTTADRILPIVEESPYWRGREGLVVDGAKELARRALIAAKGPSRTASLTALAKVTPGFRTEQEAHLSEALRERGIVWDPAPKELTTAPQADVRVTATPDATRPERVTLRVDVDNNGPDVLYRALVELHCPGFAPYRDLVVPIGRVEPGGIGIGTLEVELPFGITAREDLLKVRLRSDRRPVKVIGEEVVKSQSPPLPRMRVEARLVGEGTARRAELAIKNLSSQPLVGVEAHFDSPEIDVELTEAAARVPRLGPKQISAVSLAMTLGPQAPAVLPLDLVVEAERFGDLARWHAELPVDGTTIALEAPRALVLGAPLTAVPGKATLTAQLSDDLGLDHAVVWLNGDKIGWFDGAGQPRKDIQFPLVLDPGPNRVTIVVQDLQGLTTQVQHVIRGESGASVDAGDGN
jgi:C-terminal peptidase prc